MSQEEKSPEADFKIMLHSKKVALQNFLGDEQAALRFMSAVTHAISKVPKLAECSQESLIGAFMECAALGLYPGTHSGDCYVLPYKGNAQFQMGYRGFKTLAFRCGIRACNTHIVYLEDEFKVQYGTDPKITHIPSFKRTKAIMAYAWAELPSGEKVFKVMTEEQIMKIREMSPSKDSEYSPWNIKTKKVMDGLDDKGNKKWKSVKVLNDPELWMWQKTVFKQLSKLLPTSEKLNRAIYLDNVSERGGYIKNEKEVVEVPFEKTQDEKIVDVKDKKAEMREKRLADLRLKEESVTGTAINPKK